MAKRPRPDMPEVVDSSDLTDADWAEINKLKRDWESGGRKAFWQAIDELSDRDHILCIKVMSAFFPHEVSEAIKDEMAERGVTMEELRELLRKLESGSGRTH